ncbi:MAG TPA: peptidoglycan DD-metalloendopeptidase family protein [Gaiellaceae bacterium]|nr:peptidoglycan DD-metalloendopeptidase family protein [Gaiellaceae bacterium]
MALLVGIFLVWTPIANAWTWPLQGPVLQTFGYDETNPYAAGQHRGIDIGAAASGDPVVAPASGTVSFAGSVPTNGRCVTIETPDGYSVTLTHLGSIAVAKGASVAEGAVVGTVGPSGTPDFAEPYVHLGIRLSADANGYVDPLGLLPALDPPPPGEGGASSSGGAGGVSVPGDGATSSAAQSPSVVSTPAAPAASGGAGLVIRARVAAPPVARPTAAPATVSSAAPKRPSHAEQRPGETVSKPRAFEGMVGEPEVARPPVAAATAATASTSSSSMGLAAGPGIVAALLALAAAFVRRRRGVPIPAAVLPFPEEAQMRRAA